MAETLSPLASPAATRAVLEEHGLATKHALGQNFLVNDGVLQRIVDLAELSPDDFVLEVGPGIGTLSIALLKSAGGVVAVERDHDLPAVLADTLGAWADRFALIQKDALALSQEDVKDAVARLPLIVRGGVSGNLQSLRQSCLRAPSEARKSPEGRTRFMENAGDPAATRHGSGDLSSPGSACLGFSSLPNKLVSNLPYAVAATLILDYFERFAWLESATVMVQKEVAERICAVPGTKNYGAYTVKLRLYAEPCSSFVVGPGNFFPPPHVDSAVIRLDRRVVCGGEGAPLSPEAIRAASTMADAAFASRRKTIANSMKLYFASKGEAGNADIARIPGLLGACGIDARRRGETLTLDEFIALGQAYRACDRRNQ